METLKNIVPRGAEEQQGCAGVSLDTDGRRRPTSRVLCLSKAQGPSASSQTAAAQLPRDRSATSHDSLLRVPARMETIPFYFKVFGKKPPLQCSK